MNANYIPILKAKPGEFEALSHTKTTHSRRMLPLFEISRIGENDRKTKRFKASTLTCDYLNETAERIAAVWRGKSAMVDAFHWRADSFTETGEHVIPFIYAKLQSLDVNVVPVIGYDRWDSHPYRLAMQGLEVTADSYYCLRLDSHAIEDSDDPEFFEESIFNILNQLGLVPARCAVLLDFGDITSMSLEDLVDQANRIAEIIGVMGFKFISTAGCSLPSTINGAVKTQDSVGKVIRKEMLLWQSLKTEYSSLKWIFGDYGVRGPNTADNIIAPHTNGKIRYTINKNYYIVRGHSMQIGDKGAQMYKLAKTVVDSQYYIDENFSWGDARILACSQEEFKGRSTDWIAIDTNHHIAWIVTEVEEFESVVSISSPVTTPE